MPVQLDTTPYWIDSGPIPVFRRLDRDERADVVVIGGGITGLTAAYLLLEAGRSVVLIERARLAAIDTGHTSAHLAMVTDLPMQDMVRSFGRDHAQAIYDAGIAATVQISRLAHTEQIPCDFAWIPGFLHAEQGREEERRDWLSK